ncbi:hypothetical protein WOLCODRAFT_20497 [Wolfiporia cocos MD-104 SS10]|uniref:Uncharacterized protein n=1 Tax=Wolfiporia cocos (strain MD-104) TaxID=742152 RepID=A0A2H3JCA9_WOLCO|nr:hypothetical protein WOLCODRAFT_20497 [Wolfiporia cocos MD-104 SS10]
MPATEAAGNASFLQIERRRPVLAENGLRGGTSLHLLVTVASRALGHSESIVFAHNVATSPSLDDIAGCGTKTATESVGRPFLRCGRGSSATMLGPRGPKTIDGRGSRTCFSFCFSTKATSIARGIRGPPKILVLRVTSFSSSTAATPMAPSSTSKKPYRSAKTTMSRKQPQHQQRKPRGKAQKSRESQSSQGSTSGPDSRSSVSPRLESSPDIPDLVQSDAPQTPKRPIAGNHDSADLSPPPAPMVPRMYRKYSTPSKSTTGKGSSKVLVPVPPTPRHDGNSVLLSPPLLFRDREYPKR